MKAITINAYGTAPALTELPKPRAGRGQVLIRIRAAGMSPMDGAIASGVWKDATPATFPLVLGADVAGVVEAVGRRCDEIHRGRRTLRSTLRGAARLHRNLCRIRRRTRRCTARPGPARPRPCGGGFASDVGGNRPQPR